MAAQIWVGSMRVYLVEDVDPTNGANKTTRNQYIGWAHHYVDNAGVTHEYWQLIDDAVKGTLSWDGGGSGQTNRVLRMEWQARNSNYDNNPSAFSSACKTAFGGATMKLEVIAFTRQTV